MAILENETKKYYKLNYDNSFAKNGMAYAELFVYKTAQDRQNEKNRLVLITQFFSNCEIESAKIDNDDVRLVFNNAVCSISRALYSGSQNSVVPNFDAETAQRLTECGYQAIWVQEPIKIVAKMEINCGNYNCETLSFEFFYKRIKDRMHNIQDV